MTRHMMGSFHKFIETSARVTLFHLVMPSYLHSLNILQNLQEGNTGQNQKISNLDACQTMC